MYITLNLFWLSVLIALSAGGGGFAALWFETKLRDILVRLRGLFKL